MLSPGNTQRICISRDDFSTEDNLRHLLANLSFATEISLTFNPRNTKGGTLMDFSQIKVLRRFHDFRSGVLFQKTFQVFFFGGEDLLGLLLHHQGKPRWGLCAGTWRQGLQQILWRVEESCFLAFLYGLLSLFS